MSDTNTNTSTGTNTSTNTSTDTPNQKRNQQPRSGFHLLVRKSDQLSGTQAAAKAALNSVVQVFDPLVKRGHHDSIAATAVQMLIMVGQRELAEQRLWEYLKAKVAADAANERKPKEQKLTMDQLNLVHNAAQRVGLTAFDPWWSQRDNSFFIPAPAAEAKRILKTIKGSEDPMTQALFPVIGRLFLKEGLVQNRKKTDEAAAS